MTFLLDTNVVSELHKRRPDQGVLTWFDSASASDLFLSVLVIGEIRQGIDGLARKDPVRAEPLERWLEKMIAVYGDRIVPVTAEIANVWGRLNVPNPVPAVGGLLAATALVHGWTLVTRNTADVDATGVPLLNPFVAKD